jgi:hypothetical protein
MDNNININKTINYQLVNQITTILEYYKNTDYIVYEKLIYCLCHYQEEEEYLFCYNEHDNGGYVNPPKYFIEFSKFMDSIRPIYNIICSSEYTNLKKKYQFSISENKHFDWNNPDNIIKDINFVI